MSDVVETLGSECLRDQHRIRGLYHLVVTEDALKAGVEFQQIVNLSPMDGAALNNLAVCRFQQLDFSAASELSVRDLQLYPTGSGRLENAALFAFYAGDFDRASELVERLQDSGQAGRVAPVIPVLVTAIKAGPEAAIELLENTDASNSYLYAVSADLKLAMQDRSGAQYCLEEGINYELAHDNLEQAARMYLMKEELFSGSSGGEDLIRALELSGSTELLASAAALILRTESGPIDQVCKGLRSRISAQSRAYARMARGIAASLEGDLGDAIDQFEAGLNVLDLWLIRYCLAMIYEKSDIRLEARDQFSMCVSRPGEGAFALLDDIATYRYLHHAQSTLRVRDPMCDAVRNLRT